MFTERDRQKCQGYAQMPPGADFTCLRDVISAPQPASRAGPGCGRYLRFCREFTTMADVVGIDLDARSSR